MKIFMLLHVTKVIEGMCITRRRTGTRVREGMCVTGRRTGTGEATCAIICFHISGRSKMALFYLTSLICLEVCALSDAART